MTFKPSSVSSHQQLTGVEVWLPPIHHVPPLCLLQMPRHGALLALLGPAATVATIQTTSLLGRAVGRQASVPNYVYVVSWVNERVFCSRYLDYS